MKYEQNEQDIEKSLHVKTNIYSVKVNQKNALFL